VSVTGVLNVGISAAVATRASGTAKEKSQSPSNKELGLKRSKNSVENVRQQDEAETHHRH